MGRQRTPSGMPTALERRSLLYGKESVKADHRALGDRYFEAGRIADALEFYGKVQDQAGIEKVRRFAVENGDAFLLAQIERLTGRALDPEFWREAGRNAENKGRLNFARQAFEKAGDTEAVARFAGEVDAEA